MTRAMPPILIACADIPSLQSRFHHQTCSHITSPCLPRLTDSLLANPSFCWRSASLLLSRSVSLSTHGREGGRKRHELRVSVLLGKTT